LGFVDGNGVSESHFVQFAKIVNDVSLVELDGDFAPYRVNLGKLVSLERAT
jgi:hypothetical protein